MLVANTWTTEEVAKLYNVLVSTLNSWVRRGFIDPVHKGSVGKGNGSLFSDRQVAGLGVAAGLHNAGLECSSNLIGWIVRQVEGMNDQQFDDWLNMKSPVFCEQLGKAQEAEGINSRLATANAAIRAKRAMPEFVVSGGKKKRKPKKRDKRNGLLRRQRDKVSRAK